LDIYWIIEMAFISVFIYFVGISETNTVRSKK